MNRRSHSTLSVPIFRSGLGYLLYVAGRYDKAEVELQKALELNPQAPRVHFAMPPVRFETFVNPACLRASAARGYAAVLRARAFPTFLSRSSSNSTCRGRFPFEKLTKFYSLDQINQGGTIKPSFASLIFS